MTTEAIESAIQAYGIILTIESPSHCAWKARELLPAWMEKLNRSRGSRRRAFITKTEYSYDYLAEDDKDDPWRKGTAVTVNAVLSPQELAALVFEHEFVAGTCRTMGSLGGCWAGLAGWSTAVSLEDEAGDGAVRCLYVTPLIHADGEGRPAVEGARDLDWQEDAVPEAFEARVEQAMLDRDWGQWSEDIVKDDPEGTGYRLSESLGNPAPLAA